MVLTCSHRIPRVLCYSGYPPSKIDFAYETITLCRPAFQLCSTIDFLNYAGPNPFETSFSGLGSFAFAHHYLRNRLFTFFSSGYLDVSVPRVPLYKLCIYLYISMVFMDGFPHSDIGGSQNICFSPPLFAAYHVLLRLPVPRHPPCALFCLTISTYSVMSDGLFNLSIALVCFCYSLKNNRFDVLIFHQFIFSMQFSRNIFRRCMIYNLLC